MGLFYLIASIFAESIGNTIDRLNFRRNNIGARQLLIVGFVVMSVSIGLYLFLTRQPWPVLNFTVIILLLLIGLFSFGGNIFDELSLKANDLSLREPLVDSGPIIAGLIAYFLFPAERKPIILIAFILGAFIVHWGIHRRKLRRGQTKGMSYLLIGTVLYAVLPSLYQEALKYITPGYIAFFRVVLVLLLLSLFFRPKTWRGFTYPRVQYAVFGSLTYAVGAVVSIYAVQTYGAVVTMLFFMLGPALRYLAGQFIVHEKVRKGEIFASLMLTVVVAIAAFAN